MAHSKKPRGGGGHHPNVGARNVSSGHSGAEQVGHGGRSRGNPPTTGSFSITQPTGQKGSEPQGFRARPQDAKTEEDRRALGRQNDVAALLASNGYQTLQRPSDAQVARARQEHGDHGDPLKNPDYLLEGRVFDCYSPNPATSVRNVWSQVRKKGRSGQTERVVVDLKEWNGDMSAMRKQFEDWTLPRIKEVKLITPDDQIIQIVP